MKSVVSLFDESGNALRPWAAAGFACYAFDILNIDKPDEVFPGGGFIRFVYADLMPTDWRVDGCTNPMIEEIISIRPVFVMGFPPCTDLAVSGARHFEAKRARDPDFQDRAVALCRVVETVGERCGVAWFLENPVSVLSSKWRKPDHLFHPCYYGGYLPEYDVHPRWPEYIMPRDAYEKLTKLWTGGDFAMPDRLSVDPLTVRYENGVSGSTQFAKLGGKSAKTKQIRSETARGFALANCIANMQRV